MRYENWKDHKFRAGSGTYSINRETGLVNVVQGMVKGKGERSVYGRHNSIENICGHGWR